MPSNQQGQGEGQEIRARNLEQLLQRTIALQQEPNSHAHGESNLTEEDRVWLSNALSGAFSDPSKEMMKIVHAISSTLNRSPLGSDELEEVVEWGECLQDLVEDINVANDFYKVGGLDLIKVCLDRDESELRGLGCQLIGDLTQNNEAGQNAVLSHPSLFDKCMSLVASQQQSANVRIKAFYAISSTMRESRQAQDVFMSKQGEKTLLASLKSGVEKLQVKTSFLIQSTVDWDPVWHERLISIGTIEELVLLIKNGERQEGSSLHEMALRALCLLLQSKPDQSTQRLKDNQLGAKDILLQEMSYISSQNDREPYRDEEELIQKLLTVL